MKDLLKILFLVLILGLTFVFKNDIGDFFMENVVYRGENHILSYNEYFLPNNFLYVQTTDVTQVKKYQDILNILYTIINSGDECFSFYCDYDNCLTDVKNIIDDKDIVININNFVHPYNSFDTINLDMSSNGRITVNTTKIYSDDQINYMNDFINDFKNKNINLSMNTWDKIRVFHDYIINNTKYDTNKKYESYNAFNLITSGVSICGGYSDIMSIYLNSLGIKNYRITSENHIWNLVEVDGIWYHLDATWDDPVASDGNQYLLHNFFMISTEQLLNLDKVEHNYDRNTYLEAN